MSIRQTLSAHGLSPKKRFGQNFLTESKIAERIAEAATTPPGGVVLEIGAGLGALTRHLLERAGRVIAIERDRDLIPILRGELAGSIAEGRLDVVEADAVQADWAAALAGGPQPRVVVGNLPYLITGRLLERATSIADSIDGAVFMVQAEVSDRLIAPAGSKTYGALTVFVQAAFDVRRILSVKAGAFYPKPDVDSAVVHLIPHRPRRAEETAAFQEAVKAAFSMRRKTLRNAWRGLYGWSREELEVRAAEAGINLDARGETLGVEDFDRIARAAAAR
jgi:16S rRNA (adenine1518-N6/adenine1519-N6)-dimethyltransferase